MLDRVLPSNIAAECALLGAILSNNKAFDLCGDLQPEHFADDINREVFTLIGQGIVAGRVVDPVTLCPLLENTGLCNSVQGASAYLASLLSAMTAIANAGDYAKAIQDTFLRRELIRTFEEATDRAYGTGLKDGAGVHTAARAIADIEHATALSGGASATAVRVAAAAAMRRAESAQRGEKAALGLMIGIPSLDERWGGFHPGALDILAARSGAGKTALGSQIARAIAGQGIPVGFFSLEVPASDWATANLAALSGIPVDQQRAGRFSAQGFHAMILAEKVLAALPIHLVDKGGITLADAIGEMRALKRRHGCKLFVIDHRNLFGRDPGCERLTKLDWYGLITATLKQAAKAIGVSILLLVQLSRDIMRRDDPRPRLSDIEYAGEQDADNIGLLWRPVMHMRELPQREKFHTAEAHSNEVSRWYAERNTIQSVAELIFAKRRFGEPGIVPLVFHGAALTFSEPAPDPLDDMPPGLWQ